MSTYNVSGMTCEHCVGAVRAELIALEGVDTVEIALVAGGISTVTVTGKVTDDQVAEAIDEAGYALAKPGELPVV